MQKVAQLAVYAGLRLAIQFAVGLCMKYTILGGFSRSRLNLIDKVSHRSVLARVFIKGIDGGVVYVEC